MGKHQWDWQLEGEPQHEEYRKMNSLIKKVLLRFHFKIKVMDGSNNFIEETKVLERELTPENKFQASYSGRNFLNLPYQVELEMKLSSSDRVFYSRIQYKKLQDSGVCKIVKISIPNDEIKKAKKIYDDAQYEVWKAARILNRINI